MIKNSFHFGIFFLMISLSYTGMAQDRSRTAAYQYFTDLTKAGADHTLEVSLIAPLLDSGRYEFHMPKIVPGTYSIYDFGRFLDDFSVSDSLGNALQVNRLDDNRWEIIGAPFEIKYFVNDTYHSELDNPIFEPAGTNIEPGLNFVINTFGFFGYIKDEKERDFYINITRPEDFFGATSLPLVAQIDSTHTDIYKIGNYFDLADAPIMYSKPDTITVNIGGADILVAVYSPRGVLDANFVMSKIKPTLEAQKEYLGGSLPIDRYAFIIYLFNKMGPSGAYGALEHSYSSLYYLPEIDPENLAQTIVDVAAHEFFHIVTPLNIHSEEIHYFDFIEPKMSRHLWLYEGTTEYAAGHMQVKHGLMDPVDYLDVIRDKMFEADQYKDDLPFTEMSLLCLDEEKDQYGNVYQKGALIGLSLDLYLRELSKGVYGLQELMRDLSQKFGPSQPFKDEALFDEIATLTFPEVKTFLETYVGGPEALPLERQFALVGINYQRNGKIREVTLGNISLGYNPETKRIMMADVSEMNDFGKKMKYQKGDEIISINGQELTIENYREVLSNFITNTKEGEKVTLLVARKNEKKDRWEDKKLSSKAIFIEKEQPHMLSWEENPSEEQKQMRKSWVGF